MIKFGCKITILLGLKGQSCYLYWYSLQKKTRCAQFLTETSKNGVKCEPKPTKRMKAKECEFLWNLIDPNNWQKHTQSILEKCVQKKKKKRSHTECILAIFRMPQSEKNVRNVNKIINPVFLPLNIRAMWD